MYRKYSRVRACMLLLIKNVIVKKMTQLILNLLPNVINIFPIGNYTCHNLTYVEFEMSVHLKFVFKIFCNIFNSNHNSHTNWLPERLMPFYVHELLRKIFINARIFHQKLSWKIKKKSYSEIVLTEKMNLKAEKSILFVNA